MKDRYLLFVPGCTEPILRAYWINSATCEWDSVFHDTKLDYWWTCDLTGWNPTPVEKINKAWRLQALLYQT